MRSGTFLIGALVVAVVGVLSSIFIVDEREKALVLQFGQIKAVKEDPGLAFKIPFIQEVVRYDDRILSLDTPPIEVTPSDDRRLVVDAFARYRIADVVRFRQAVGAGGLREAESQLADVLNDNIRAVLGAEGVTSNTILSAERSTLMDRIRVRADGRAAEFGLDVVDVRLKQTNLPDQNLGATFDRMRAEREREATDERARGAEAAQRVQARKVRVRNFSERVYAERLMIQLNRLFSSLLRASNRCKPHIGARIVRVKIERLGQGDLGFLEPGAAPIFLPNL